MRVFFISLFLSISCKASSSVNWNIVLDSCLNSSNKTAYCADLRSYEEEFNNKINAILAQDLSDFEKQSLTIIYYFIKDNISLSWKIKNNLSFNLSHQISRSESKFIFTYNF